MSTRIVAPGAYTAINPFRICDTRPAGPRHHHEPVRRRRKRDAGPGHETVTAQITGAHVPSGAQAVVANITAIDHGSSPTFVTAFPAGGRCRSPRISTSRAVRRSEPGDRAVERGGQISLFNSVGSADVIVDVEGYFAAPTGASAGGFHSIPPLRICDSRGGTGNTALCRQRPDRPALRSRVARGVMSSSPVSRAAFRRPPRHIPTDGTAAAAVFNLTATAGTAPTFLSVAVPNGSDACPTRRRLLQPEPDAGDQPAQPGDLEPRADQDICLFSAHGEHQLRHRRERLVWDGERARGCVTSTRSTHPDLRYAAGPGTECDGETLTPGDIQQVRAAGVLVVPAEGGSAQPVAVVANLTGIAGSAATYFTLYPSDAPKPTPPTSTRGRVR